ncbi:proline--tRNA ligase [Clostridia bacterium]|nr:proline--tRNA ligase [Clostridia bacterium]
MKISQLLGQRFKETPSECQTASHTFLVRGGYIKNVGSGLISMFTPAKRIAQKIEQIIREEMDAIDGQEVMFPVVLPGSLWKESGRYESVGSELARFKDRGGVDMVLGMTHEEAAVHLARGTAQSYTNYPFMIYQIQTKFRDEPRARGGLIRTREFTMKDAYSFHTTKEDLEEYYERAYKAYEKIFARAGIPEIVSVKSDSGMMGGKIAHEFMFLTEIGEDSLVICDSCDYRSNMEVADSIIKNAETPEIPLEKVATPHAKTIEYIYKLFKSTAEQTCKAVVYQKNATNEPVVVFIRGDLEVNETKLRNFLREEIHPATDTDIKGLNYGSIGPVNLNVPNAVVVYDRSLAGLNGISCGANEDGFHYKGLCIARDLPNAVFADYAKARDGGICPVCGKPSITIKKGIELGNIFQLGTKYTESMGMQYIDKDGVLQYPIMGCYGIGVGRLISSVAENRHDDYGPIWPMSIAPWQVHLCAIRSDDEAVKKAADELYQKLTYSGLEVIYDDRAVSAGIMFSDADLFGVPVRVIVSPKTIAREAAEIASRDKSLKRDASLESTADEVKAIVEEMKSGSK